eukprot:3744888-Prymnesium_polylepis.1
MAPRPPTAAKPPLTRGARCIARTVWAVKALNVIDLLGLWPRRRPPTSASLRDLFGFATTKDRWQLALATASHAVVGLCFPFMYIFLGAVYESGAEPTMPTSALVGLGAVGAAMVVARYLAVTLTDRAKESQLARFKSGYVRAIVRQDIT